MEKRTFIITDLSDVLIGGMYGIADRIAELEEPTYIERYGAVGARRRAEADGQWVWDHILGTEVEFHDLLRGKITEGEYWDIAFDGNDKVIAEVKRAFAANLERVIPGTLKLYQRITAFPTHLSGVANLASRQSLAADDYTQGMPDIVLLSDHIAERIEEVRKMHQGLFKIIQREFWSCDLGRLKRDQGCFEQVIEQLGCAPEDAIFIDDQRANVLAAENAGLHGIIFCNATHLETVLKETYGFQIAPETP